MSKLTNAVLTETARKVRVDYVSRAITKWWNARRTPGDTAVFTGWYWTRGAEEGGPFKTKSAAIRDAYYRFVLHEEAPLVACALSTKHQMAALKRAERARANGSHSTYLPPKPRQDDRRIHAA